MSAGKAQQPIINVVQSLIYKTMKNLEINGLVELNENELKAIEGGSWFSRNVWWIAPVVITAGFVLI